MNFQNDSMWKSIISNLRNPTLLFYIMVFLVTSFTTGNLSEPIFEQMATTPWIEIHKKFLEQNDVLYRMTFNWAVFNKI